MTPAAPPGRPRLAGAAARRSLAGAAASLWCGTAHGAEPALQGAAWQGIAGLALVLAVILGAAWLLKRFTRVAATGRGPLSSIAALAVGPKERVVLLQCEDAWILVGVAPGRVSALHAMQRPAGASPSLSSQPSIELRDAAGFRRWLDKAMARREL